MAEVKLGLEIVDVYGKGIPEKVDIIFRHQVLSEVVKASANAAKKIEVTGLRGFPQGLYRIEIDPPSYQYVSQFVNMKASGVTPLRITFPIDPAKIKRVNFPAYSNVAADAKMFLDKSDNVLGFEGKKGKMLYDALDDIRRAGLLTSPPNHERRL
jgi:hypothetical protein